MKSTLLFGTSLIAASNAYSPEANARNLAAYNSATSGADSSGFDTRCAFRTLDQLFPQFMDSSTDPPAKSYVDDLIWTGTISAAGSQSSGDNYYGGYKTFINIPNTNGNYQYYVANHDSTNTLHTGIDTFQKVDGGKQPRIYTHFCDDSDCETEYKDSSEQNGDEPSVPLEYGTSPSNGIIGSTSTNIHPDIVPAQQISNLANNLKGVITCTSSVCQVSDMQSTWYFGVESLCGVSDTQTSGAFGQETTLGTGSQKSKIFAWYTFTEEDRSITLSLVDADPNNPGQTITTAHVGEYGTGNAVAAPSDILFSAPERTAPTSIVNGILTAVEEFSSVKEITSKITFGHTDAGTYEADDVTPTKCRVSGSSELANPGTQGVNLADGFKPACRAKFEATMTIDFRDQPSDERCASGSRSAALEISLVQFVRIHNIRTLPVLDGNTTAAKFFAEADSKTYDLADTSTTGFHCFANDNCAVGDPFVILGHERVTVEDGGQASDGTGVAVTGEEAHQKVLGVDVESALADPLTLDTTGSTVAPWSYVMGIVDYAISDCGLSQSFVAGWDTVESDIISRRLGASSDKPGVTYSEIHYGSYAGY